MKIIYKGVVERNSRIGYSGCSACGGGNSNVTTLKDNYTIYECGQRFEFLLGRTYDIPDEIAKKLLEYSSYIDGYKHYPFEEVK